MTLLDSTTWDRLVEALADPPVTPDGDVRDAIKLLLAEVGDVWPARLFGEEVAGDQAVALYDEHVS